VDPSAEGRARTAAVTGGLLPESTTVRAGGLDLHCLLWGRAGDPVAVLVHGNGGHAHWWDPVVPALVPGWRLVVPDLRGHGESAWPAEPAYGLRDFAADLGAVCDALAPGPVALVGHSMGGRVVVRAAAERADRVRGLAILDTRVGGVVRAVAERWRGRGSGRAGRSHPSRAAALAAFRFVPEERHVPPEVIALLAHHAVVERAPGEWAYRFDRAVLSLDGDGGGDLPALWGRLRCPALVMAGERSWVCDAAHRREVAAALPGSEVVVLPGGHHFLVAHGAATGAALRRFLDRLP
jgi:pimeloyl-ACP methyl ester carboxylesterase